MAESIFLTSLLIVFLARDVQLLAMPGSLSLGARLLAYGCTNAALVAGFLFLYPASANGVFAATLRSPVIWPASIAIHVLGWAACLLILRGTTRGAWTIALLPSPLLLLSLICVAPPFSMQRLDIPSPSITIVCWIALVSAMAVALRRRWREPNNPRLAIEFAGLSNLTVLAAIPVILAPA